eukprot:5174416-Amphidinium_carterae.1
MEKLTECLDSVYKISIIIATFLHCANQAECCPSRMHFDALVGNALNSGEGGRAGTSSSLHAKDKDVYRAHIVLGDAGYEHFQLLVNGDMQKRLYPE